MQPLEQHCTEGPLVGWRFAGKQSVEEQPNNSNRLSGLQDVGLTSNQPQTTISP
jgi:hypothetical protein